MTETVHAESDYRPDSQPPPVPSQRPAIADLVMADIAKRKAYGIEHYGTPLQSFNGRDALTDAYDEILDHALYLRQEIDERENPRSVAEMLADQAFCTELSETLADIGAKAVLEATRRGFAFAAMIVRGIPTYLSLAEGVADV